MLQKPLSGLCALIFWISLSDGVGANAPNADKTFIWGLGLEPNAVLPARFFFIQAVDESGKNLTSSPGENTFEVKISSPSEPFSRIWVQVLDRQDGSFLVRYRMYASYPDLNIQVLLKNKHVAKSPYILKGPVYHESCDCPESSGALWETHMHCPHSFAQIQRDLSVFPRVDLERNSQEIPERFGQRQSLCHYTIKNNLVYIKTYGEHVGFRIFMDAFLLSLARKVKLPDVEFFVNLGDWPLEKRRTSENLHPIFSWCGSNDTRDIVMPTYDLTESVLETMGRVSLDMLSVQGNTGPPWEEKNETGFWRGRDSRRERLELVKLGRSNPTLLDTAFTNFFFFKHDESLYGPLVKHVSFFDFFKYKYQINVDGTVAAYRMPYLLAGDSVVLKQDSVYYEHFYSQLEPWVHYIPFKADLSDLLEKIQWAKDHDEEARRIAQNGQRFARVHLMGDQIFCYYFKLFQEYAKLLVTEPKVRDGMELVEQPKDDLFPCYCHRNKETVTIPFGTKVLDGVLTVPHTEIIETGVILTHGAGGDMNLKALRSLSEYLGSAGVLSLRFTCKSLNLSYRVRAFRAAADFLKSLERFELSNVFLAGRSMGARAAVALGRQLCAEEEGLLKGIVCVSFPLHPPGQTHTHVKRSEDLRALSKVPVLLVSGTVDNMCERKLLEGVLEQTQSSSYVHWVEGANHGLGVKGRSEESVLDEVNSQIFTWIKDHV